MSVLVLKMVFEKWRKVSDGVLGGYCHGMGKVQSTWRVLPRRWKWSCLIDLVYKKMGYSLPRDFTKNVL
jgi:hypothetical protein